MKAQYEIMIIHRHVLFNMVCDNHILQTWIYKTKVSSSERFGWFVRQQSMFEPSDLRSVKFRPSTERENPFFNQYKCQNVHRCFTQNHQDNGYSTGSTSCHMKPVKFWKWLLGVKLHEPWQCHPPRLLYTLD